MVFINITDGTDKKNLYESWPILVIAVGFYICIYAAGAMAVKFFKLQEVVSESIGRCCCSEISGL